MTNFKYLVLGASMLVLVMFTSSALAEAAIFVKLDNVKGDVRVSAPGGTNDWFVAHSFSFGVERELKESGEKGGTEDINIGIGELQEVVIAKSMDSASSTLAQFAINGNSLGKGEICFTEGTDTTGNPQCYLHYKLDRVFVKSWSTSGDADDRPTEEVAFYYNKIAFAHASTNNVDNKFEQDGTMSWDNVKNTPWSQGLVDIFKIIFP